MITNNDIVMQAREWVGSPFKHQGRQRVGVDCIGLVVGVMRELGLDPYDEDGYPTQPDGRLEKTLASLLEPCDVTEGALLLFRIRRDPQHVGICTGEGVIHAYSGIGKVVEHGLDDFWSKRLIKAYKLPEVLYVN